MKITAKFLRREEACYDDDRLAALFPVPRTLLEVLTLREGPWKKVPPRDQLWVAHHVLSKRTTLKWMAAILERKAEKAKRLDDFEETVATLRRGRCKYSLELYHMDRKGGSTTAERLHSLAAYAVAYDRSTVTSSFDFFFTAYIQAGYRTSSEFRNHLNDLILVLQGE